MSARSTLGTFLGGRKLEDPPATIFAQVLDRPPKDRVGVLWPVRRKRRGNKRLRPSRRIDAGETSRGGSLRSPLWVVPTLLTH
jgi:hypothetical protein